MLLPQNLNNLLHDIPCRNAHFIHYNNALKQHVTLFFKNWIISGIIFMNSLNFRTFDIDEIYIYNKICDKRNVYFETLIVTKVLFSFK